ncbi:MAG: transporter substrate-binding domain-containing protein, partial [Ruminococcus sp.]|nr:transporter substrate-binding domain-containing protein [Ruminococcus sp.]
MLKRSAIFLIITIIITSLFAGCSKQEKNDLSDKVSYEQFIDSNATFAVQSGDVFADVAKDIFKATDNDIQQYKSNTDCFASLDSGKVDAVLTSDNYAKQLKFENTYPDFNYLTIPNELYICEAAAIFHTEELRDTWNEWFQTVKADGTWERDCDFWMNNPLP